MKKPSLLFVSNLFPDAAQPYRGLDNATLLQHLAEDWDIRVLSPRPALAPFPPPLHCRAADERFQPIYQTARYLPKIGSAVNHRLMARAILAGMRRLPAAFRPDLILTSWLYPDACGAAIAAARHGIPFAAIAQGSDVHQYLSHPTRRRIILKYLGRAGALITRSRDLEERLRGAGLRCGAIETVYNGVELDLFHPGVPEHLPELASIPSETKLLLYVGNFLPVKQPLLLMEAHAQLCLRSSGPTPLLIFIGAGPLQSAMEKAAQRLGSAAPVVIAGRKSAAEIAAYMRSADLLCLASANEGVPNVILEALASGLPVAAPRVGGLPEIIREDFLGRLAKPGSASALADAMAACLDTPRDSAAIRAEAARFAWPVTARSYTRLLRSLLPASVSQAPL